MMMRSIKTHKGNILLILKDEVVIKKYKHSEKAKNEFKHLMNLSNLGLKVPEPYILVGDTVVRKYIRGKNVAELLANGVKEGKSIENDTLSFCLLIAKWLEKLKSKTSLINKDPNLRNFIINTNGDLYCVDLEDLDIGPIEQSIGYLCQNLMVLNFPLSIEKRVRICEKIVFSMSNTVKLDNVWYWVERGFMEKIEIKPRLKDFFEKKLESFKNVIRLGDQSL